jgi:GH15 family glucan-1,4-alpha-glucosidase
MIPARRMPQRIEDYALLGDTQTAALVARNGCIDWLCLPRFDSDACFAALLGTEQNGLWRIFPRGEIRSVKRRYLPGTLVLETEITTQDGAVRLIDLMPPREETPDLVRIVEGVRGRVPVDFLLRIRFGYGRIRPWLRHVEGDWVAVAGPDLLALRAGVPVESQDADLLASFTIEEGDRVPFVLTWSPSNVSRPQPVDAFHELVQAAAWWQDWVSKCRYRGQWDDSVKESLVVLKALTYLPTGGIVAAATTSLPEEIGGVRNWDYRYCWLRDAAFTLRALLVAGFDREAIAWRDWLVRAVAGDPAQLQVLYGCAGERRLPELEIPWLTGFEGSRPVRIGNAAIEQVQLDTYGEVLDALQKARDSGIREEPIAWELQRALMDFLESNWRMEDHGIWEVRGPRRAFTYSRLMAWVGVDRAVRGVERSGLDGPVDRWRALREVIRREVLEHGFDAKRGTFTQYYGSTEVDAALLRIPLVGFLPATDPRVRGTVEAIQRDLLDGGLVRRYVNRPSLERLPGEEGVFLACSFWLVENLMLLGRADEARDLFERLLGLRNDVGLLSEQYDPHARRMLGNFPQAFSHVALVNGAWRLSVGIGSSTREM